MKIQNNAVNVLERTSAYLKSGLLTQQPAWYNVVAAIPPSKKFTRNPRFINPANDKKRSSLSHREDTVNREGLYKTRPNTNDKRSSVKTLYKPVKLQYMEDELRELFYKQHPWELARPKILVENEVGEKYDWSHIQQLGKPLDGESVVQRTVYLLKSGQKKALAEAYDQARYEFYRVRMQQEIQEQVAQEEAGLFGSVFGPSLIEHGLQKEQAVIDTWKRKAIEETELLAARRANPSDSWSSSEKDIENEDKAILDDEFEEVVL